MNLNNEATNHDGDYKIIPCVSRTYSNDEVEVVENSTSMKIHESNDNTSQCSGSKTFLHNQKMEFLLRNSINIRFPMCCIITLTCNVYVCNENVAKKIILEESNVTNVQMFGSASVENDYIFQLFPGGICTISDGYTNIEIQLVILENDRTNTQFFMKIYSPNFSMICSIIDDVSKDDLLNLTMKKDLTYKRNFKLKNNATLRLYSSS